MTGRRRQRRGEGRGGGRRRLPWLAVAGLSVLPGAGAGQAAGPTPGASTCALGPVTQERLRDADGRFWYVEPQSAARSEETTLLAGTPTYVWEARGDGFVVAERHGHAAALIGEDGVARLLGHPPLPTPAADLRVATLRPGSFGVVFATAEDPIRSGPADTLWFARLDGRAWSTPEPIPAPPRGPFQPHSVEGPVVSGGDIYWGARVEAERLRQPVVVLRRGASGWNHEIVTEAPTETATLVARPQDAPVVVGLGPSPDRVGWRDLVVYARDVGWRPVDRISVPSGGSVGRLRTVPDHRHIRVAWTSSTPDGQDRVAWAARVDLERGTVEPASRLLGRAGDVVGATVAGRSLWVVATGSPTGSPLLEVVELGDGGAVSLGAVPNPYLGYFTTLPSEGSELVLVGPQFVDHPTMPAVLSLRVRLPVVCR